MCRGRHERALHLYNRAVGDSNFQAMFELGKELAGEKDGIEKDAGRAAELHSRAIDYGGHVGAMSNLAVLWEAKWGG